MSTTLLRPVTAKALRVAGLMSGTSADGVDAVIMDVGPRRARVLAFETFPYARALRLSVLRACEPGALGAGELCRLNFAVGEAFAAALLKLARRSRIPLRSIDLIGSHGQTIWHDPPRAAAGRRRVRNGSTLQLGEPCVIAERTGIATVADFRPRDMAAGGQGAPLVPFADLLFFRHPRRSRAVLNVGGIANVTWLPAAAGPGDVLAFDTGPGNMVLDRLAWRASSGRRAFDAGGRLAARGRVDRRLLAEALRHPFLRRRPPKSTGREEFGAQFADDWWRRARARRLRPEDALATATAFTARSIGQAFERFLPGRPAEVLLCGGGAHNRTLAAMLRRELPAARLFSTDRLGIPGDAREAAAFAALAWATARGLAGNVPAATGARRPAILGKIVPGNG